MYFLVCFGFITRLYFTLADKELEEERDELDERVMDPSEVDEAPPATQPRSSEATEAEIEAANEAKSAAMVSGIFFTQ